MGTKISKPKLNAKKLEELIVYIACKSQNDRYFGMTKLNKLLYYSDFMSYLYHRKPIAGATYTKKERGPMAVELEQAICRLKRKEKIALSRVPLFKYKQKRVVPLEEPKISSFSAEEISLVDEIIDYFKDDTAKIVSEFSHGELGWKAAKMHEVIPYEVILVMSPRETKKSITPFDIERIKALKKQRKKKQPRCLK